MEKIEKIRKAYLEYVLENGHAPVSFFAFAKKIKIPESDLYEFYTSFEAIDRDLWVSFFEQARTTTEQDSTYAGYSVREKLLAFYYTWIEVLKANRSYITYRYAKLPQPIAVKKPQELRPFYEAFISFAKELLYEGRESREVIQRPFVTSRYPQAVWLNTLYLLDFWVKDKSKNFELTDTAIEKTVNTAFDLMGHSIVDSALDLAKFVFQNK
ncbi:MAG: TetR family transcriptional regulator C-terminal domain-containing protein [Spirosomataceae bacterium]